VKALQLFEPRQWREIEMDEPGIPGPGEALVRVHRVGVCGTDYAGYLGKMPFFSYPRIPGHELGVEVVSVGDGVDQVQPGDTCAVEPYINCQKCPACLRGFTNCCQHHQTLGVHCDGGLRPLFIVPARKLHVSKRLSMDQLALVETLAIGCHAVNRAKPQSNDTVLVIGAGPIGLSVVEFARLSGARTIVMDLQEQRLDFVKENLAGVETLIATSDGSELNSLWELTEGRGAEVVVDATGHAGSMGRALEFCAFAGRLVYVGITQGSITFQHAPVMHRRELTLLASRNALASEFRQIIEWIEAGQIKTDPWISHRTAFLDLPGTFETLMKPESRVIKAMVELE
jgi:alcohol dehydrogenase